MSAAALTNLIDYANFADGYLVVAVAVVADCVAGPVGPADAVGFAVPAAVVVAAGSAVADFDSGFAGVVGLAVAVAVGSVVLADFAVDY